MKKASNNSAIASNYAQFIGKTYQLSKHNVCVEDVIAEGGFSIVFLVRSNRNGKKYALKRMYVNNETDLEMCKFEIQIIKALSEENKNILRYVDSSIQRQSAEIYEILLLTKYCKMGGVIQLMNDRLSSGRNLKENEILRIFCDVCEALADLHANGIIHRDLKIENILIDEETLTASKAYQSGFHFVLCDFGSATKQVYDRRQQPNLNVQLVADDLQKYTTPAYRSPEMVDLYSNKPITTRSDIWALGCLLYKLCYFQVPFGESLLAIQEGRFTIPDQKAGAYSKQINCLINYMLETDPTKRPDIYQVSSLAFKLAQKPCPIKNINRSETPTFDNLHPPHTETEWRNKASTASTTTSSSLSKKPSALSSTTSSDPANTTVNPRERPKAAAHIAHPVNPMIPLVSSGSVATAGSGLAGAAPRLSGQGNKLSLSIKPLVPTPATSTNTNAIPLTTTGMTPLTPNRAQEQFGFEDDFSSLNTLVNANTAVSFSSSSTASNSNLAATATSSNFRHQQQLPGESAMASSNINQFQAPVGEKAKSHRRSASHSSTTLVFNESPTASAKLAASVNSDTTASAIPDLINMDSNGVSTMALTPAQLLQQQLQYQYQMQQQQQMQYQVQHQQLAAVAVEAKIQHQIGGNSLLSIQTNNRLFTHSRSASASPNVISQAGLANMAARMSILPDKTVLTQSNSAEMPKPVSETARGSDSGGNLMQLNDNDMFGLEFDRIRQKNELEQQQQQQNSLLYQPQMQNFHLKQQQQIYNPNNNLIRQDKPKNKVINSGKKKSSLRRQSKKQQQTELRPDESTSENSYNLTDVNSSDLSTGNNMSANDQLRIKYSNLDDKNSNEEYFEDDDDDGSNEHEPFDNDSNSSASVNRYHDEDSNNEDETDPFRRAPLYVYNFSHANDATTSNSSTTSNSFKSSSIDSSANSTRLDEDHQQHQQNQAKNTNSSTTIGLNSAFQPYKKHPDPFISAPFDLVPSASQQQQRKVSASSTSNSVTPTNNLVSKKPLVGASDKNKSLTNEFSSNRNEDDEIVEVIKNTKLIKSLETPASNKKKAAHLNNPFVAAPFTSKKSQNSASRLQQLKTQQPQAAYPISNSNSSNSILSTLGSGSTEIASKISTEFDSGPLEKNLMSAYDQSEATSSVSDKAKRMSQSKSLNEIKQADSSAIVFQPLMPTHTHLSVVKPLIDFVDASKNQQSSDFINAKQTQEPNLMHSNVVKTNLNLEIRANSTSSSTNSSLGPHTSLAHNKRNTNPGGGISNMSFDDY